MDKFTATVTISMSEYEHLKSIEARVIKDVNEINELLTRVGNWGDFGSRNEWYGIQNKARELRERSVWKKSPEAK